MVQLFRARVLKNRSQRRNSLIGVFSCYGGLHRIRQHKFKLLTREVIKPVLNFLRNVVSTGVE